MKTCFVCSLLLIFWVSVAEAQQPSRSGGAPAANSLQQQFNSLKNRSSSYQENQQQYKVVRLNNLESFWKSVQDTVRAREKQLQQARKGVDQELVQARESLKNQNAELESLKEENALKEQQVQKSAHDIATISVLGVDMPKQTYVILNFALLIILVILVGVMMFLYKNSKQVTDEKKKAFSEIDQEFNEFKQKARERELKVKRELQTEMNRVEELNQQIASLKKQAHI